LEIIFKDFGNIWKYFGVWLLLAAAGFTPDRTGWRLRSLFGEPGPLVARFCSPLEAKFDVFSAARFASTLGVPKMPALLESHLQGV
jgi:hypothetical protein